MASMNPFQSYRKFRGISRSQLAKELGVSDVTIWRWETGERVPEPKLWPRIWKTTGIIINAADFQAREAAE